jgi:hypothetical protein
MRLQVSRALQHAMRNPANAELRQMVRALFTDPRPGWATPVTGWQERYEFEVLGQFVQYEIDESGGEMVIRATLLE